MNKTEKFMIVVFVVSVFGLGVLTGGELLKEDTTPYQTDIQNLINLVVDITDNETYDKSYEVLSNLKSPSNMMIEVQETITITKGE